MSGGARKPLVRALDVRKSFGETAVLRGVDLEVQRGEVLCIIGPSGSGKTQLLQALILDFWKRGGKQELLREGLRFFPLCARRSCLDSRQKLFQEAASCG